MNSSNGSQGKIEFKYFASQDCMPCRQAWQGTLVPSVIKTFNYNNLARNLIEQTLAQNCFKTPLCFALLFVSFFFLPLCNEPYYK